MMNINWEDSGSLLLLNPSYSQAEKERFHSIIDAAGHLPGHIWLSTSGSSSLKWVGLAKQALLSSAEAVNQHLNSDKEDCWINALPHFHVGGLGIWARAFLSQAKVCDYKLIYPGKWDADSFYRYIEEVKGTLTSLVSAQLLDLVKLGKRAPPHLRAVIVGGGTLIPHLYEQALILGWPVLPSYGLTECSSQVATASLESLKIQKYPPLQLLSHLRGQLQDGHLCFAGSSLLTTYAFIEGKEVKFNDPKVNYWFRTDDVGLIQENMLSIYGRKDSFIKIGGETVDIKYLDDLLQTLRMQLKIEAEVAILAMPDSRLGQSVHLVSNSSNKEHIEILISKYQATVLPFERIRRVHLLEELPMSDLGKIQKERLFQLLD